MLKGVCAFALLLAMPLLACEIAPGQQDDRRANAGCLIIHDGKVLLVTHRWGGKLGVPGGSLEEGESAQCTAWRETREETGLAVTVGRRLQVMKNGFHLYACTADSFPEIVPVPASGKLEISHIGWYRPEQLRKQDWRFAYQFEQFMQLLESENKDNNAAHERAQP